MAQPGRPGRLSTKQIIFLSVIVAFFTALHLLQHLFDLMKGSSFKYLDAPHIISHPNETLRSDNNISISFTEVPYENSNASPITHNINDVIIGRNGVKCDDIEDCRGFFQYSGPNHSPNATRILRETADAYHYAAENNKDGHLIFFPNKTKSVECILDWKIAKNNWAYHGMSSRSEDMIIFESFFSHPSFLNGNHFYMEIGAHDGVRESNSRFFDICLGWQGLLVEPHPGNFDRMEKLRPDAHHLGIAPSCNTSGFVMFPRHKLTNAVANQTGATLEIHCGPLSYYLEQLGIRRIDFWSLDVEGSELNVLKTVDFDKVEIDIIIAESENRLEAKQKLGEEVRSFLRQKGYLILASVEVFHSDVFLHKHACHRYNFLECASFK